MRKNNNIPPAIFSFNNSKSEGESGRDDDDDDKAFLIPSYGSSFNLDEDTEYLLPKSSSHYSSQTSKSGSKSSRAASNASHSSSASKNNHRHRQSRKSSGNSDGKRSGGGAKKPKQRHSSSSKQSAYDDSFQLSNSKLSRGYHSSGAARKQSSSKSRNDTIVVHGHERRNTMPEMSEGNGGMGYIKTAYTPVKKSSSTSALQSSDDGYVLGYDSDIPPTTVGTTNHGVRRSKSQTSINTIHSGRSYNSNKSGASSNRSGKSIRRRNKLKRQEKRREWVRRWRRRRFIGTVILTVIYSLLCAFTILVTLGPLALYIMDPDLIEWCPYYWDEEHYNEYEEAAKEHSKYYLNIDQLQRTRLDDLGNEQLHPKRQRLDEFLSTTEGDLKRKEVNLLKKTSKDVHTNDERDNNEEEQQKSKYENPDYNDSPCHLTRIPFLFYLTLEECDLSRRMAVSVLLGGFIGFERRASDR